MASLSSIEVKQELRPCLVNGKKALFHRWEEYSTVIPPSIMVGGHGGGEIKLVYGIIEDEKGQVGRVNPTAIQFLDNKIQDYVFPAGSSPEEVADE